MISAFAGRDDPRLQTLRTGTSYFSGYLRPLPLLGHSSYAWIVMRLPMKKVYGLPVKTQANISVGTIADVEIDVDTGRIEQFLVHTKGMVSGLFAKRLVISWAQVIRLTESELVVEDSVIAVVEEKKSVLGASVSSSPAQSSMSSTIQEDVQ